MAEIQKPVIIKEIPASVVANEGSPFTLIDFKDYIKSPNVESGIVKFYAELNDGDALPSGLICTQDGLFGGIPHKGTAGSYEVIIIAENEADDSCVVTVVLNIREGLAVDDPFFLTDLKSKIWKALGENLALPEFSDVISRPITPVEIYYLLQRFAVLTIWDVYNLEEPTEKVLLTLPDANKYYNIYDKGSCLVAAPKDLFSHERTLADALQTAKVLAREAYKRGWAVEFAGFNKMVRAAWIELQLLGEKNNKHLEILHHTPSEADKKAYAVAIQAKGLTL
jgi:hypothetical protein